MTPNEPLLTLDPEYERDHRYALELARLFDDLNRAHAPPPDALPSRHPLSDAETRPRVLRPATRPEPIQAPPSLLRQLQAIASFSAAEPGTDRGQRLVARMMLVEMLEKSRELDAEQIASANERFAHAGLPTVQSMQSLVFGAIPTVMTRGRIESESEYYLVMTRFIDPEDTELSSEQRAILTPIVSEYEQRTAGTRPRSARYDDRAGVSYKTVPLGQTEISKLDHELNRQRFPIRMTGWSGAAGRSWHGTVQLNIESDDIATRERIGAWLRSRPEVASVEVDLTGPWSAPGPSLPPQ